ncbi:STAS domain-containing protein [Alkalinema sp. FACHB-956]|nr:STAS domain-containing protein [Alkalinema sp. FACHB-956]MBD2327425.1 STAS domain-containing protein [Alkalinema sp. FACHB-956]
MTVQIETKGLVLLQPQFQFDEQWLAAQMKQVSRHRSNGPEQTQVQQLWVLDLSAIDSLDSTGLVALASGVRMAKHHGARMVICGLSPSMRLILEISRLDNVLPIVETYEGLVQDC